MSKKMRLIAQGACLAAMMTAVSYAETLPVQILSATVKDQRIAGATVIVQKNGAQSATATTDAQGMVNLNTSFADADDALIIVKKPGYSNLVAKCPCKGMTYAVSPVMKNLDGLRVVLNWGATPADLDSHIAFPGAHIFWNRKSAPRADANLDVDDTDGFGPETITIEKKHVGQNYVYAVHDYTNMSKPSSTALSRSGAKVMVYIGQSLVRSYYVPRDVPGNLWTVFRITGEGEFQDINTMRGTNTDPDRVLGSVENYLDAATRVDAQQVSGGDADNAKSLNRAGEQAYHAGDLERSIELYQQAINLDPNYGQAYSNLGLANQKAGRTAEAIWANRKAIALASGATAATVRASSYFNIGRIYEEAGQFDDALVQFESAKREKANPAYDKAIARVK
ncbi:tetratricopeptide repeat protein, partial [Chitinimonas sp.]|uniref:tetratricopeptide repeat protein n=1 Tax=Chitinimonas sp. TaxID=1934313 RepID=UPI0035AEFDB1